MTWHTAPSPRQAGRRAPEPRDRVEHVLLRLRPDNPARTHRSIAPLSPCDSTDATRPSSGCDACCPLAGDAATARASRRRSARREERSIDRSIDRSVTSLGGSLSLSVGWDRGNARSPDATRVPCFGCEPRARRRSSWRRRRNRYPYVSQYEKRQIDRSPLLLLTTPRPSSSSPLLDGFDGFDPGSSHLHEAHRRDVAPVGVVHDATQGGVEREHVCRGDEVPVVRKGAATPEEAPRPFRTSRGRAGTSRGARRWRGRAARRRSSAATTHIYIYFIHVYNNRLYALNICIYMHVYYHIKYIQLYILLLYIYIYIYLIHIQPCIYAYIYIYIFHIYIITYGIYIYAYIYYKYILRYICIYIYHAATHGGGRDEWVGSAAVSSRRFQSEAGGQHPPLRDNNINLLATRRR